jgi:hypothetical protein
VNPVRVNGSIGGFDWRDWELGREVGGGWWEERVCVGFSKVMWIMDNG